MHYFSALRKNFNTLQSALLFLFFFKLIFIFWPFHLACGILVPQPEIEPSPPAVEALSLNHWTAREVPTISPFKCTILQKYSLQLLQQSLHRTIPSAQKFPHAPLKAIPTTLPFGP